MDKILSIILLLFFALNLSAQNFKITGEFTGFEEGTKFYLEDVELESYIDSAQIKNQKIVFEGSLKIHSPKLLFIYSFGESDEDFVWCNLFIGNEEVTIKADKNDFPFGRKVIGSKHQNILNKLENQTVHQDKELQNLHYKLMELEYESEQRDSLAIQKTNHQIDSISKITIPIIKDFIKDNFDSYAGLHELNMMRGLYSKDSLKTFYNQLSPIYKNSIYGERLKGYLEEEKPINIGDRYLDFSGVDQHGNEKQLSEFMGQKYILLNFTGAYCTPCVKAEKELMVIYQSRANDLQIISLWIDKNQKDWKKGMVLHKTQWPNLWNGEGYYGETVIKYGGQATPTFFLMDPNGLIVDKWIGYSKGQIEEKVLAILNQRR